MTGPIVITGFMGCGKTEVAHCLAQRLGFEMVDLDEVITKREARTPAELISAAVEPFFRAVETRALAALLTQDSAAVIALGGGAWIESSNRDLIGQSESTSVWLDTPFAVCWQRIEADPKDRPLGRTSQQAKELFEKRRPIYRLAQIHVQVSGDETPDELAVVIQAQLEDDTRLRVTDWRTPH